MHPSSCLFLIPPRPRDQNPISRFKLDADATLLFAVWAERVPRVYMKREPNRRGVEWKGRMTARLVPLMQTELSVNP